METICSYLFKSRLPYLFPALPLSHILSLIAVYLTPSSISPLSITLLPLNPHLPLLPPDSTTTLYLPLLPQLHTSTFFLHLLPPCFWGPDPEEEDDEEEDEAGGNLQLTVLISHYS